MAHVSSLPAFLDERTMAALSALALRAAQAVLSFRKADLTVRAKPDSSPVTEADEASEGIIMEGLARLLPGVPVVSEEQAGAASRPQASVFLLVDPLDGTREFVAGCDEFTINIGVVAEGAPVAGVIAAPARGQLWRGVVGRGAERLACAGERTGQARRIRTRAWPGAEAVALVSRSHLDPATAALLDRARIAVRRPCGSALKFCLLAEGSADLYARLAPTSEWDVAAGHALLVAAGGALARPDATPLRYGGAEPAFRIPGFVAGGDPAALMRFT